MLLHSIGAGQTSVHVHLSLCPRRKWSAQNSVFTAPLMCLYLCVFLHSAWSVWWQHLPALCTGELPSAPPVGKGAFGFTANSWPYSFFQPQPQSYRQFMLLTRRGRSRSTQAGLFLPGSPMACGQVVKIPVQIRLNKSFVSHRTWQQATLDTWQKGLWESNKVKIVIKSEKVLQWCLELFSKHSECKRERQRAKPSDAV